MGSSGASAQTLGAATLALVAPPQCGEITAAGIPAFSYVRTRTVATATPSSDRTASSSPPRASPRLCPV